MPQLRLTEKFAKDIKALDLERPEDTISFLDDWVIDVIRIKRKKVALVTHVLTKISFLIPYARVGGAAVIPDCIPVMWTNLLFDEGLESLAAEVEQIFSGPIYFCKTNNRKILGYMNDFKRQISSLESVKENLDEISSCLNDSLIKCENRRYKTPLELLHAYIPPIEL